MAGRRGHAGHENGPQPGHGCLAHRLKLGVPLQLQLVGELDDEDAVFGHQADQGDQADLGINVHRRGPAMGPEGDARVRHFQESENQRPENSQGHGAG